MTDIQEQLKGISTTLRDGMNTYDASDIRDIVGSLTTLSIRVDEAVNVIERDGGHLHGIVERELAELIETLAETLNLGGIN